MSLELLHINRRPFKLELLTY